MILRFSFSLSGFHPSLAILADEEEASQGISRGYFSFWKWIRGRIDIEHSIRRRVDSVVKSGRCIRVIFCFFLVQPSCWCVFFSVFWVFQSFFFGLLDRFSLWSLADGPPTGGSKVASRGTPVAFHLPSWSSSSCSSSSSSSPPPPPPPFWFQHASLRGKPPPPEKKAKYKEKEKNKKTEQEEEE